MKRVLIILCALAHVAPAPGDAAEKPPAPAHAHAHPQLAADPVPGDSLYQLDLTLVSSDGRPRTLGSLAGRPVLITMFYASCDGVCPLLAFTMQRMEKALDVRERARLQVVMVSFDPARDTPARLREFADLHHIDERRWLLAGTAEAQVRELAAVLGTRYRESTPGIFSHSAVMTLLDVQGKPIARTTRLTALDPQFMSALRAALRQY